MNRFCPNLSNPQVKQEFTELVQAVGEDAAYFLWDKNNGYHLDKAPNGADSKLFNDLVKYYEGDRTKALQIKSRVYSDAFKEWFGDWQSEDKTNVSKVVDKNGEPQIVWHGTEWEFNTFELDTENKRGRHKVHPNVAVGWFTDRRDKAAKYHGGLIQMPVFLNFKNPGYSNIKDFKTFQAATENESRILLDDNYDSAIIVRFDKEGDKNGFIPTPQWAAKHANQIKSIENEGTWSKSNNNIYKYRLPENVMQLSYSTANVCDAQIFSEIVIFRVVNRYYLI